MNSDNLPQKGVSSIARTEPVSKVGPISDSARSADSAHESGVDREIMELLSKAEDDGITRAMEAYGPRLRRTVRLRLNRRICGRVDESDVLQETFIAAMQDLPNYASSPTVPVFVWLHQLTTRRLVDLHRKHLMADKRSAYKETASLNQPMADECSGSAWALSEIIVSQVKSPSSEAVQVERQSQLLAGLQQISEMDREVLLLRHFELFSNSETAAVLGISETAANNRYVRSLQRLSKILSSTMEMT